MVGGEMRLDRAKIGCSGQRVSSAEASRIRACLGSGGLISPSVWANDAKNAAIPGHAHCDPSSADRVIGRHAITACSECASYEGACLFLECFARRSAPLAKSPAVQHARQEVTGPTLSVRFRRNLRHRKRVSATHLSPPSAWIQEARRLGSLNDGFTVDIADVELVREPQIWKSAEPLCCPKGKPRGDAFGKPFEPRAVRINERLPAVASTISCSSGRENRGPKALIWMVGRTPWRSSVQGFDRVSRPRIAISGLWRSKH